MAKKYLRTYAQEQERRKQEADLLLAKNKENPAYGAVSAATDNPVLQSRMLTVLGQRNVSNPYRSAISGLTSINLAGTHGVSPAFQNFIGEVVAKSHQDYWMDNDARNPGGGHATTYQNYFGTDADNLAPEQIAHRQGALASKPLGILKGMKNALVSGTNQTWGSLYPAAFQAETVGELANWHHQTATPGMAYYALEKGSGSTRQPGEIVSDMYMGVVGGFPSFKATTYDPKSKKEYTNQVGNYFADLAFRESAKASRGNPSEYGLNESVPASDFGEQVELQEATPMFLRNIQGQFLRQFGRASWQDAGKSATGEFQNRRAVIDIDPKQNADFIDSSLVVRGLAQGGPLAKAGVANGDVIFGMNALTGGQQASIAAHLGDGGQMRMLYGRIVSGSKYEIRSTTISGKAFDNSPGLDDENAVLAEENWLDKARKTILRQEGNFGRKELIPTGLWGTPAPGSVFARAYDVRGVPVPVSKSKFPGSAPVGINIDDFDNFRTAYEFQGNYPDEPKDEHTTMVGRAVRQAVRSMSGPSMAGSGEGSTIQDFEDETLERVSRINGEVGPETGARISARAAQTVDRLFPQETSQGSAIMRQSVGAYKQGSAPDDPRAVLLDSERSHLERMHTTSTLTPSDEGPDTSPHMPSAGEMIDRSNPGYARMHAPNTSIADHLSPKMKAKSGLEFNNLVYWSKQMRGAPIQDTPVPEFVQSTEAAAIDPRGAWIADQTKKFPWMASIKYSGTDTPDGKRGFYSKGKVWAREDAPARTMAHEYSHGFHDVVGSVSEEKRAKLERLAGKVANRRINPGGKKSTPLEIYLASGNYNPSQVAQELIAQVGADVFGDTRDPGSPTTSSMMKELRGTTEYGELREYMGGLMKSKDFAGAVSGLSGEGADMDDMNFPAGDRPPPDWNPADFDNLPTTPPAQPSGTPASPAPQAPTTSPAPRAAASSGAGSRVAKQDDYADRFNTAYGTERKYQQWKASVPTGEDNSLRAYNTKVRALATASRRMGDANDRHDLIVGFGVSMSPGERNLLSEMTPNGQTPLNNANIATARRIGIMGEIERMHSEGLSDAQIGTSLSGQIAPTLPSGSNVGGGSLEFVRSVVAGLGLPDKLTEPEDFQRWSSARNTQAAQAAPAGGQMVQGAFSFAQGVPSGNGTPPSGSPPAGGGGGGNGDNGGSPPDDLPEPYTPEYGTGAGNHRLSMSKIYQAKRQHYLGGGTHWDAKDRRFNLAEFKSNLLHGSNYNASALANTNLGNGWYPEQVDAVSSRVLEAGPDGKPREVASIGDTRRGIDIARGAISTAVSGPLPDDPISALATAKKRISEYINKSVDEIGKTMTSEGASVEDTGKRKDVLRKLATKVSDMVVQSVSDGFDKEISSDATADKFRSIRVKDKEDAARIFEKNPKMAARAGSGSDQLTSSTQPTIMTGDDGTPYEFGGKGGGSWQGGQNGSRGLWGSMGKIGMGMYGAYMIGREWKMAVGQPMQDAKAYSNFISSVSASSIPEGVRASGTIAGANAREELTQMYFGKAAQQTFGSFNDLGYMVSGSGESFGRVLTSAKVGAGVATGGAMAAGTLGMMGVIGTGAVAPLAIGAAAIGIGIAGSSLISEALRSADPTADEHPERYDFLKQTARLFKSHQVALGDTSAFDADAPKTTASTGVAPFDWLFNHTTGKVANYFQKSQWLFGEGNLEKARGSGLLTGEEEDVLLKNPVPAMMTDMIENAKKITAETGQDIAQSVKAQQAALRYSGETTVGPLSSLSANGPSNYTTMAMSFSKTGALQGYDSPLSLMNEAASYAENLGFIQGTAGFSTTMQAYGDAGIQKKALDRFTSGRISQMGNQLQAQMGRGEEFHGLGSRLIQKYDIQTQAQAGNVSSYASSIEQYNAPLTASQWNSIAGAANSVNPFVGSVISGAVAQAGQAGLSTSGQMAMQSALSGAGMTNPQAGLFGQMLNGDMGALSFASWQAGTNNNRFFDLAGNPIQQSNGTMAVGMLAGLQGDTRKIPEYGTLGDMPLRQFSQSGIQEWSLNGVNFAGMNNNQRIGQVLGTSNQKIIDIFGKFGMQGLQWQQGIESANAQMAQAGIQAKGIALTEKFNWGTGTWNNPAPGSMWNLEDQSRALQHSGAVQDFAAQRLRTDTQNTFSIEREQNSLSRMQASQYFNTWQMDFNRQQSLTQQSWAQEDWQYQDTQRGLQNQWNMEDLGEDLRFATGRNRKKLLKQRDRMALTTNLEEDQIETTRDRQKEIWTAEEERYTKTKQYQNQLNLLDAQSFDMNRSQREKLYDMDKGELNRKIEEYTENKKIQDEMQQLQRKYQMEQMQLQKEAAGAAAGAAAAQRELIEAQMNGTAVIDAATSTIGNINHYDAAFRTLGALDQMMRTANNVSTSKIQAIIDLLNKLTGTVGWNGGL